LRLFFENDLRFLKQFAVSRMKIPYGWVARVRRICGLTAAQAAERLVKRPGIEGGRP